MRRRRVPLGIAAPIALLALVGTLASLQYKWLGQVSEAERDEMHASLERRAREFGEDFDRDLSRVFAAFQAHADTADATTPATLARAWSDWRATAGFPDLIDHVFVVSDGEGGAQISQLSADGERLDAIAWPTALTSIRVRLNPLQSMPLPPGSRGQIVAYGFGPTTVVSDVPALMVPVPPRVDAAAPETRARVTSDANTGDVMFRMRMSHDFIVLQLNRAYLKDTVVPALVDRHFSSERFRVAIVDAKGTPLVAAGWPADTPIESDRADVVVPFFSVRSDTTRETVSDGRVMTYTFANRSGTSQTAERAEGRGGQAAAPLAGLMTDRLSVMVERSTTMAGSVVPGIRLDRDGWRVLVQHAAGSLDAAVAQTRRRNLWLSFGILSVLVASVGLVLFNARRSERLAAQQMDFVATVSHELRTPLTVIRSAAQNLSAGVVHDAAQAQRYGDLIETEGRRLTDMVEQVLEYAGLSGNRRRPIAAHAVDAGALAREVVATCASLFDAGGVDVEVSVAPDVPAILADEDALRRALQNLIANALKYGADGRWVGVSVQASPGRGGSDVQIAVSDRGRGIDAADLPHIFEPFYRGQFAVERQIHGNGLGLSLVKRIAEAHGGRVTVKSAPGQGATFTLHLPAASPDAAEIAPLAESPAAPTA